MSAEQVLAIIGGSGLYRIDANGTSYGSARILGSSSVVDGDRLRLIARGPVIYGVNMYPFVIAAADFNGDGDTDLIMVDSTLDYITLLENGENGNEQLN